MKTDVGWAGEGISARDFGRSNTLLRKEDHHALPGPMLQTPHHSGFTPASRMIGHHFPISSF
jgi:hypothetical protein